MTAVGTIEPHRYPDLLRDKMATLCQLMPPSEHELEVFPSPPSHYRMRAEFRLWHEQDECYYAMFDAQGLPVRVDCFAIADRQINRMMASLAQYLRANPRFARRLFQVEFHCSSIGERLVTLIYRRPLPDGWLSWGTALSAQLKASVIGRSRGERLVVGQDFIRECMQVSGIEYRWRQPEGCFTQTNATVNREMLQWVSDCAAQFGDTLLELHCGSGNFTLPVARLFKQVLAADTGRRAISALVDNLRDNHINNVWPLRMSAQEVWQALRAERRFRRLRKLPRFNAQFNTLLVDPPRIGLDEAALSCARTVPEMLYISCNPHSLRRDLECLPHHRLRRLALFDQFPYTPHIECGAWLSNSRPEEAYQWPSPP